MVHAFVRSYFSYFQSGLCLLYHDTLPTMDTSQCSCLCTSEVLNRKKVVVVILGPYDSTGKIVEAAISLTYTSLLSSQRLMTLNTDIENVLQLVN